MPPAPQYIEGVDLNELVDPDRSAAVMEYLARSEPSCHSDPAEVLIKSATPCGDWIVFSPSFAAHRYLALITNRTVFALGIGLSSVCYRLPDDLRATALTTGAVEANDIGSLWVRFELFRADRPAPDLAFWTLRAYAAAREDSHRPTSYYRERLSGSRLRRCYEIGSPRIRRYLDAECAYLAERVGPGETVLELGCGYGRVMEPLAARRAMVVGVDVALDSLVLGAESLPGCSFVQMDATRLGFPDARFDVVLCAQNGICAFRVDPATLLAEALRVVRPGGLVIISTYAPGFWPHRLAWFEAQSREGLLGPIDYQATAGGVIVCKDGFRSGQMTAHDLAALCGNLEVVPVITEVDGSSLICEIRRGTAP